MTNHEIADMIYERACGTPQDVMMTIDYMIEDGEFSAEYFQKNEIEIISLVDDRMFCCEICGWNYEISEISMESSNMGSLICCNCGDEND